MEAEAGALAERPSHIHFPTFSFVSLRCAKNAVCRQIQYSMFTCFTYAPMTDPTAVGVLLHILDAFDALSPSPLAPLPHQFEPVTAADESDLFLPCRFLARFGSSSRKQSLN